MASNITLFLGLITSCLLLTGCRCLECYSCNKTLNVDCSTTSKMTCTGDDNICAAVSFSAQIGNQMESKIVKGCDKGFPGNIISESNHEGLQILSAQRSCNSSLCNENIIDNVLNPKQDTPTGDLQCYSCFSTNISKCSNESAEKVKCPVGFDTCFEAEGNLTILSTSFTIFAKKCSVSTDDANITIYTNWYRISLIAKYCTGDLCNENLFAPPKPTTEVFTTEVTNSTVKPVKPVTPAIQKTTNGIGRIHSCYVAMIILVLMKSFL